MYAFLERNSIRTAAALKAAALHLNLRRGGYPGRACGFGEK
jgi:hypothetical protein